MPASTPNRPHALALGLLLPIALAGGASAQTSWVDPPPRPAVAAPAKESMKAAAQGQAQGQITDPAKQQTGPARQAAGTEPADDALPKAASTRAAGPKRAAALERPPVRETLRRRGSHPHRLAETPAAVGPMPVATPSAERAAAARALAASYLATVSGSGDTMVGATPRFYGTRVRFYGRPVTQAGLLAEKRSFVQRWPERRYEPRAIRTACDSETCTIHTIVDFRTASPDRGTVSTGAAELILEVSFSGARPVIVGETGRVLRRNVQAATLAPSPGKA
ncbi:hypothetical protein [Methylobacterium sp. NEAU K]|uniref:hypothetical protein n=1 Tax=Methylobacterium sp. NEAU K TaxID=3064946 RepID=UPI002732CDE3|nr:hypothetical protein [Methylobacterium sp. NEAU K]MDP4006021.1 hypothetical protein [Methylobacterium sp. NEAU K]